MFDPLLMHIRLALMRLLVDGILHRIFGRADACGEAHVGVFCDTIGGVLANGQWITDGRNASWIKGMDLGLESIMGEEEG
jgi:hypothetical protein